MIHIYCTKILEIRFLNFASKHNSCIKCVACTTSRTLSTFHIPYVTYANDASAKCCFNILILSFYHHIRLLVCSHSCASRIRLIWIINSMAFNLYYIMRNFSNGIHNFGYIHLRIHIKRVLKSVFCILFLGYTTVCTLMSVPDCGVWARVCV